MKNFPTKNQAPVVKAGQRAAPSAKAAASAKTSRVGKPPRITPSHATPAARAPRRSKPERTVSSDKLPKPDARKPNMSAARLRSRLWGSALLLALAGFCGLAGYLDGYGQHDHARPAHAIVILGAHVLKNGVPGDALSRRTRHAVHLYQRGLAPKIICTGGVGVNPPAEARAAARLAMKLGVPERDLVLEDQSRTTWENASNAARICNAHGWKSVIVVSDPYHIWRARRDFQMQGLAVYPSPARNASWFSRFVGTSREVVVVMRDLLQPRVV